MMIPLFKTIPYMTIKYPGENVLTNNDREQPKNRVMFLDSQWLSLSERMPKVLNDL